jgi:TPR repeat protein
MLYQELAFLARFKYRIYKRRHTKDLKKIFNWVFKVADQNNCYAQYDLVFFYEHGKGIEKDLQEAIKWYLEAANK